ncbi:hypothetical protein GCM10008927_09660 [Amylibacter ulvae]|uniref:Aminoglycoside phosphotransferase domain-containing protein n=1 Tax=Paramylibacter ulvae TaxID=1651968 RepID=A0ABQ3CY53_9RHOB|nr:aminoglycoside phosphotransferase family protein [Amylibacter ulvae]GHA46959.1 hypothetical protein GCM10008927_09660 [Amylibacter ulvae]
MENAVEILDDFLTQQGVIDAGMKWQIQTGGRTNHVWHLRGASCELVCKLYNHGQDNPLFANTPAAEFACLQHLDGLGVAPSPHAFVETPLGQVLLYFYVKGEIWQRNARCVAELLGRVHSVNPPNILRHIAGGVDTIIAQTNGILERLDKATASGLLAQQPCIASVEEVPARFIHTDVVTANLIEGEKGLCLIDWQCPAIGDPIVDMAMFLSPAMHHIYGSSALGADEQLAFLAGFDAAQVDRYKRLAPLYHWRMAAYCAWRAQNGDAGYGDAAQAELDALELV